MKHHNIAINNALQLPPPVIIYNLALYFLSLLEPPRNNYLKWVLGFMQGVKRSVPCRVPRFHLSYNYEVAPEGIKAVYPFWWIEQ